MKITKMVIIKKVARKPLESGMKVVKSTKAKVSAAKKAVSTGVKSKVAMVKRATNATGVRVSAVKKALNAGVKAKVSYAKSAVKTAVKSASSRVANRVARLSGVKKWEFDIKKIDKAHDFLTDYYHNTEFGDIHYGAFGVINLKKIDKSKHGKLFTRLLSKKYDKELVKDAFKVLKIKSIDVKGKNHDQITRRIGNAVHSLHLVLKNKIEDRSAKQKLKMAHSKRKMEIKSERRSGLSGFKHAFNAT